jgi:hypothetical protein
MVDAFVFLLRCGSRLELLYGNRVRLINPVVLFSIYNIE